jgi:hypothetical protein
MALSPEQSEKLRKSLELEVVQTDGQFRIRSVQRIRIWPLVLLCFALWLLASVTSNSPFYGAVLVLFFLGLWARAYAVGRRKTVLSHGLGEKTLTVLGNVYRVESFSSVRVKRHESPIVEVLLDRREPTQSEPVVVHRWEQEDIFCTVPIGEAILAGELIADVLGLPLVHNDGVIG